jgi:hypothetical protein
MAFVLKLQGLEAPKARLDQPQPLGSFFSNSCGPSTFSVGC